MRNRFTLLLKICDYLVADPLHELIAVGSRENRFSVYDADASGVANWVSNCLDWVFRHAGKIIPRNSWPWNLARDGMSTVAGQWSGVHDRLEFEMLNQEAGPLRCLAYAGLMKRLGLNTAAQQMASKGLHRMSFEHLTTDLQPLLDPKFFCGSSVRQLASFLKELNSDELQLAQGYFCRGQPEMLRNFTVALRTSDDLASEAAFEVAIRHAWESGLQQSLQAQLEEIAQKPSRAGLSQVNKSGDKAAPDGGRQDSAARAAASSEAEDKRGSAAGEEVPQNAELIRPGEWEIK